MGERQLLLLGRSQPVFTRWLPDARGPGLHLGQQVAQVLGVHALLAPHVTIDGGRALDWLGQRVDEVSPGAQGIRRRRSSAACGIHRLAVQNSAVVGMDSPPPPARASAIRCRRPCAPASRAKGCGGGWFQALGGDGGQLASADCARLSHHLPSRWRKLRTMLVAQSRVGRRRPTSAPAGRSCRCSCGTRGRREIRQRVLGDRAHGPGFRAQAARSGAWRPVDTAGAPGR